MPFTWGFTLLRAVFSCLYRNPLQICLKVTIKIMFPHILIYFCFILPIFMFFLAWPLPLQLRVAYMMPDIRWTFLLLVLSSKQDTNTNPHWTLNKEIWPWLTATLHQQQGHRRNLLCPYCFMQWLPRIFNGKAAKFPHSVYSYWEFIPVLIKSSEIRVVE